MKPIDLLITFVGNDKPTYKVQVTKKNLHVYCQKGDLADFFRLCRIMGGFARTNAEKDPAITEREC